MDLTSIVIIVDVINEYWCFPYQFRPDFEACLEGGVVGGREGKEGGRRGGGHGSIMAGSRSWEIYYYSGWLHQPYRIMQWPRLESAPCRAAGIALLYGVFLVKKSSSLWIRARRLRRHTLVGNCQKCFPNLIKLHIPIQNSLKPSKTERPFSFIGCSQYDKNYRFFNGWSSYAWATTVFHWH